MRSRTGGRTLLAAAVSLCCSASGLAASSELLTSNWVVARSAHFEVYSDAGPDRARQALTRFEELRSFFGRNRFVQAGSQPESQLSVRVIGFNSPQEYNAFRLRPTADAYYIGTADRNYIVMPMFGTNDWSVAAHEYAHFVLHSAGLQLPNWLNEGLAELFSTVSISARQCEFGGGRPAHLEALRRHPWLPASDLLTVNMSSPLLDTRAKASTFYAESWALTDMLMFSPQYAPHFAHLIELLRSGIAASQEVFAKIYGKSPDAVLEAARDWIMRAHSVKRTLAPPVPEAVRIEISPLPGPATQAILADLLFVSGDSNRAEQIYRQLLQQSPSNPEILASLGAIALRKSDRSGAVNYWRKALDGGLTDAALCFRYALLADEMELPSAEIERALEQAIALQPAFDDARYKLALLQSNAGRYEAAVQNLQAMSKPSAERSYAYWTALANALSELGRRDEAKKAAGQAQRSAASPEQHARAAALAYVAATDMTVRFAHDDSGNLRLVTTRIPHGTNDFNPFIESEDRIQVVTGTLQEVQCSEGRLIGFTVDTNAGLLTLSVPDPLHVLMRNGPAEFNCGPQSARNVKVEYATAAKLRYGLLRGMEFQ